MKKILADIHICIGPTLKLACGWFSNTEKPPVVGKEEGRAEKPKIFNIQCTLQKYW